MLAGIASGLGVGVIRGLNVGMSYFFSQGLEENNSEVLVGVFAASNWAMATFSVVTLGMWYMQRCYEAICY